ncbi:DUF1911 domain-containing protein [Vibrio penaeicida]|uniref:DUF1911 domain-containing protein n=1 Tax=Vibrio penaeicida TaxID=104609 RepID=A0AAV5NVQ6_9VIBR|nr:DUF1911 domain-containing protein [Vibrio penaeicida]RTZ23533.1 DUF1911 domain-containing protein [Vibrio penaeicida]GLQ74352.1 hypothetical protein GCM10007932_37130 [Vibrio penaeicida]
MDEYNTIRRDSLLEEETFLKKRGFFLDRVKNDTKALDVINNSTDAIHRSRVGWDRFTRFLEHSICGYSGGVELSIFSQEFAEALETLMLHKTKASHFQLQYWEKDSFQYILWLLSLSVLLGQKESIGTVVRLISKNPIAEDDPLLSITLSRLGYIGLPRNSAEKLVFETPYVDLYDAVKGDGVTPTKVHRQESIKRYLKNWYKGSKGCYWHDRHKGRFPTFFGYWAFEAALVTVLYELDDSSYRHLPFYPKDIVDHARQAGIAEALKPNNIPQHYIAFPNDESPVSAEWVSNLSNESIFVNQGEKLPTQDDDENKIFWVSV